MRIVFFSHYFPPEGNAPASRTFEHCRRWVDEGCDVTVITCVPNVPSGVVYNGYKNRLWPQRENAEGIKVIRVWTLMAANAGMMRRIANYVSYMFSAIFAFLFFVRRPQVVIATSPQFFCGWAGVFASWVKWTPLLLEIRDIWPESIVTVGAMRKGLAIRTLEVLEKWMYRLANHIVAVGNGYRENILKKVDIPNRVSVVTNGVDIDQFQPQNSNNEFLENYNLKNCFVCSYVGTIGMAHGLEIAINAAKILQTNGRDGIKFLLIGDGARREDLQKLAVEKAVAETVKFTGRLDKSEIPTALASSNVVLVHLKKTELFSTVIPSKIFETLAMERPIIIGVPGEAQKIVEKSGAGFSIESDNAEHLAETLIKLVDNAELTQGLCKNARQWVAKHYSRDFLAQRMLKIIRAVSDKGDWQKELDKTETSMLADEPENQQIEL